MDTKQIVTTLSKKIGRESKEVNSLLEALISTIKDNSGNLDCIAIPGFGKFVTTKEDEKIVTDLTSGKRLLLPPQIILNFEPSGVLRKKISEKS